MPICKATDCGRGFKREKGDLRTTWCSVDCAVKIARARQDRDRECATAKAKKKEKDKSKAIRKDVRDLNRRTLSWQHKQTQKAFNRLRVFEEKLWFKKQGMDLQCISCGNTNMTWSAGHFISVGASSSLRYDPDNVWLQCWWNCNKNKSSNRDGYEAGLVARFGEDAGLAIIEYCKTNYSKPKKWGCAELEQMRAAFSARARALGKEMNI